MRPRLYGTGLRYFHMTPPWRCNACPFAVLGLTEATTTETTLRKRYRELVLTQHPDVGGDEDKFRKLGEAFQMCLDRINGGTGDGTTTDGEREHNRREANRATAETYCATLRDRYASAKKANDVHAVFVDAINTVAGVELPDLAEPLMLCLLSYTRVGMPGAAHLKLCLEAIGEWEAAVSRTAHVSVFHYLLTVYGGTESLGVLSSTDVVEHGTLILDTMSTRGLGGDDWTMYLANNIFRYFPNPSW